MVNNEFKLKLYFSMYKDYPIASRDSFREFFMKKNGRFNYLPELILMIEEYQRKKFGEPIWKDPGYKIYKKKGRK